MSKQYQFEYYGVTYSYEMMKTRRKRMAITITSDGRIQVRLPQNVSYAEGSRFVNQKRQWIVSHQKAVLEEIERRKEQGEHIQPAHSFETGDVFYYRGTPCTLSLRVNLRVSKVRIEKCGNQIILSGPPLSREQKKDIIEEWFKRNARIRFRERCDYYAPMLKVHYQTIRVKNQKSRWGSCSSRQNLNFNWRLLMAPDSVLDYVVVHELCHLREMNHSSAFWSLVASIMPDYKKQEEWLKKEAQGILNYV